MYPGTHATTRPDRAAVIMAATGETVTWRALNDRSIRLARYLRERGVQAGDPIAVLMDNQPGWYDVAWAGLRSGLRVVPVNWHLTPGEIAYILNDCRAGAVVASTAVCDVAEGLLPLLDATPVRLMASSRENAFGTVAPSGQRFVDGYEQLEDVMAATSGAPLDDEPEGAMLLYSSGTTGRPKGIFRPLSGRRIGEADEPPLAKNWGLGPDTVFLSPAPLYHSAPIGYTTMLHRVGATVVLMERFDAEAALAAIERYRCDASQFVPTHFIRMLRLPDEVRARYDVSSMRCAIHAAAPCPPEVKKAMIDWWGPVIGEYYAASEGIGSTQILSEDWLAHPGSVGRARSGVIHILDDDGHELPAGEVGTVWFENSGPGTVFEYLGDAAKTAEATSSHGYRTVGDMGHLDADGYLYLSDRKSFMIISGGVNIYPAEAENVLIGHPKVVDVAVIGVPHAEMGEEVKAVVQLADLADASPSLAVELIGFCREQLAHYKCPRSVDFVDVLPRTDAGKLLKRLVRERYW